MNPLLRSVIEAHGGLDRWNRYKEIDATLVSGGGIFPFKGMPGDPGPRHMTARLHEERVDLGPFGAVDQQMSFTPRRAAVERSDGTVLQERADPRAAFAGHQMTTPWDALHLAYFNGEALWTYFTTPFLLALPGVRIEEAKSWAEGAETWRVLRAFFPNDIVTHSPVQDFFFGDDFLLRRHDYKMDIAGGFAAAQLVSDYVEAQGIRLPTTRRAYPRGPDGRPIFDMRMVYIDISDVLFR